MQAYWLPLILAGAGMAIIGIIMYLVMRKVDKPVRRHHAPNALLDRTSGDIKERWYHQWFG